MGRWLAAEVQVRLLLLTFDDFTFLILVFFAESAMKRFLVIVVYQLGVLLYICGLFVVNYQDLGNFAFLLYIFLLWLY
jgi:hypothetical protein